MTWSDWHQMNLVAISSVPEVNGMYQLNAGTETMMPEAFENGCYHISLATVAGFLVAFILGLEHF